MRPILFELGPLKLHSYGLLLVIGFFAGVWNACREAERRGFKPDLILDLALPLLLISVAACRLLYVALNPSQFGSVAEILRVWDGGLSFHGAFIGGFATIAFYSWKNKVPFRVLCDLLAPSVFLGYFFGRIGCFLNGCCYGYACELPWAMQFPQEDVRGSLTPPSHPAQLYSAFLALGLFFVMQRAKFALRFNQFAGQLTMLFLALYMIERAFMEYFRLGATAEAVFGISWLTKGQFVSVVVLALISVAWFLFSRRASTAHTSAFIAHPSNVSSR